ncbi:MAG TPA: class II aldolase/adducin family protein [Acidobacteriota bacterium]|nr:class II aldolase/adducin family protein [Acidobacteriota bacterium]
MKKRRSTGNPRRAISNRVSENNNLEQAVQAYGRPKTAKEASAPKPVSPEIERLFHSPEAEAIKAEICAVGWKLWMRSYVDGNGGNISCRLGEHAVICTPTLLSKIDLKPEHLCLVDLEGNQLAGELPRTSEVFLHLEIYKTVPEAKAVVHCHPPHATAYAITGCVPPSAVIPEFDVFVGSVAISHYETPGTKKFAETVIPFVKDHNTVLLGNHGIVCWADTPTHAEWYAENLETYCWTLLISSQLGVPYEKIPAAKEQDLLAIKKRLGLPDARFTTKEAKACGSLQERPGAIALAPQSAKSEGRPAPETIRKDDVEAIVKIAVDAAIAAIKGK